MVDDNQLLDLLHKFAVEVKQVFQNQLVAIILFGSYAAGTQEDGSDIDLMILVEMDKMEIKKYRSSLSDILFRLDFEYDVVMSPIIQNYKEFEMFKNASGFFKNVDRQGVKISA